jgi:hypothetical protein
MANRQAATRYGHLHWRICALLMMQYTEQIEERATDRNGSNEVENQKNQEKEGKGRR